MTTIQFRRGTASEWTTANPTLAAGEAGYETDTGKFKIGNGSTAWNSLSYFQTGAASASNSFTTISTTSGTAPVADSSTDTLTLTAGTGITITGDSSTDTITIASTVTDTNTTYTLASGTNNGTLKLTPSSGSVQDNIAVTGLGTGAYATISNYAALSGATFTGDVVLAGTSASTDVRTLEITSQGFARIDMTGDSGNAAGEPGGAAITFANDSAASTYGIVSAVNAAGSSGVSGISYTGSLDNSMLVGTNGALPLTLGTNNNVRMTIDSAGDASLTGALAVTGNTTLTGTLAVNGGSITSTDTTFDLLTGASTITIGAGTGNVLFQDNISAEGYITARRASNQDSVRLLGRAGGTGNYDAIITPTTLSATRTFTLPDETGTVALTADLADYAALAGATFSGQIQSTHASTWSSPAIIVGGAQGAMLLKDTDASQADALIGANAGNFYILGDTASDGTYDTVPLTMNLTSGDTTFLGVVTASSFSGNASSATAATNITISTTDGNTSDTTMYPVFVAANTTGNQLPHTDVSGITYNASTNSLNTGIISLTGDLAVNGGDITSTAATFNLINTNATTLNIGGAAATLSIGSSTSTVTFGNIISADEVYSTNNGNGTNFKVGDDTWLGDINISNTLSIRGQQDAANAYIVFGNGDTKALGRAGTGRLTYDSALVPATYYKVIDATAAGSSLGTVAAGASTTYSAFGTNGISLAAGAYEIDCLLLLTSVATGTSGTPATLVITPGSPSGPAVPTENQLYYTYSASTTVLTNAAAVSGVHRTGTTSFASLNTITIGTGTTSYLRATVKGIVRIGTAGNFTFRLAYTGATTGSISAINLGAGSFLKVTPLGTQTITDIGTWA
jgi:hypothetical protein